MNANMVNMPAYIAPMPGTRAQRLNSPVRW